MSDAAKTRILAEFDRRHRANSTLAPWRAALASLAPAWFEVAEATAVDREFSSVLYRLCELLAVSAQQSSRRADHAEARLAESRRSHLSVVPELPPADEGA